MGNDGSHAGPAFSPPSACSRGCFAACSWNSAPPFMSRVACGSSPITRGAFTAYLAPLRKLEWIVYSKRPFGGPEAVLAYLSLYTHRIAISNSRLVTFDNTSVTFRWKDYRTNGRDRAKVMTLAIDELLPRFLIHV